MSDHSLIYTARKNLSIPKSKPKIITSRQFKRFNPISFKRDIDQAPWHELLSFTDPINAWGAWKDIFLEIANAHAPNHAP